MNTEKRFAALLSFTTLLLRCAVMQPCSILHAVRVTEAKLTKWRQKKRDAGLVKIVKIVAIINYQRYISLKCKIIEFVFSAMLFL